MAMLTGMLGSLASFYHNDLDLEDPEQRRLAAIRLIAKVPTIAAACYRYSIGWPIRYPRNNLDYTTRFLHMMKEVPSEPLELNPVAAKALDLLFILHADHEQNASTSTVRLVGSTGANPYVCVAAGVAALWGPAHGGANEAVLKMLAEIGRPENVQSAVDKAKDKESGFRLMGFGHRVYKNYDPRAALVRKMTHDVLGELGVNDPLLEVAMQLEEAALKDEYFVQRKLYPNVDFYSRHHLQGAGHPGRDVHGDVRHRAHRRLGQRTGWSSRRTRKTSIGRPRQIYTGSRPARLRGHGQALSLRRIAMKETPRKGRFFLRAVTGMPGGRRVYQPMGPASFPRFPPPPAACAAAPPRRAASAARRCRTAAPGAGRPAAARWHRRSGRRR